MYQVSSINYQVSRVWKPNRSILFFIIFLLVIIIDQISKYLILKILPQTVVLNQKGVWGIGPWWAGVMALLILGYYLIRYKQTLLIYWLIFGAGISNIIDRIIYNGVIDWIHTFPWFPVFNLADMAITIGVILLLFSETINNRKQLSKSCNDK